MTRMQKILWLTAILVGIFLGLPTITHAQKEDTLLSQKKIYLNSRCIGGCPENSYCTTERIKVDINTSVPVYKCKCHVNYIKEGDQCVYQDPCIDNGGCHEMAVCTPTKSGRACECVSGYSGNGFICCPQGYTLSDDYSCVELDKCANVDCNTNTTGQVCFEGVCSSCHESSQCGESLQCCSGTCVSGTCDLRIASWNLHEDYTDGYSSAKERIQHGIETIIIPLSPDIISLQEVIGKSGCINGWTQTEMIDYFLDKLNKYSKDKTYELAFFVRNHQSGSICKSRSGLAMIYNSTRLMIDPETPYRACLNDPADPIPQAQAEGPSWCINRRGEEKNKHIIAAGIRFLDKTWNKTVNVFNVHPAAGNDSVEHNKLISELIYQTESLEGGQLPVIVAGDFNASRKELNSISSIFMEGFLESADDGIDHILVGADEFITYYNNSWKELDYFFEYYNQDGLIHSDHSIISKRIGVAQCPALNFENNECL